VTEDVKGDEATDTVADDTADETVEETAEETAAADTEAAEIEESEGVEEPALTAPAKRGIQWSRLVAFVVLPALALVLAAGAGYLKWLDDTNRAGTMSAEPTNHPSLAETTVQAAREGTIALLSYTPDKVEEQLGAARDLLTGEFRESYTSLTNDVVIPGAREKQISAIATVPAAASVSLSGDKAVVLLFVNQTVTVGQDAPTDTASSVRVTLEKVDDRWLISQFDPV
jgi:Mce-associated membrane protein